MDTIIRSATVADVDAVRSVGVHTWPSTYAFAGGEYVADGIGRWWSTATVRRGVENGSTLVAERGDEIVGMALIDVARAPAIIWKLYVLPAFHGTGAGHALMGAACERASQICDAVRLEYSDGNERARRFYERHGFVEVERAPSTTPGWPDGVWMEKRLDGSRQQP